MFHVMIMQFFKVQKYLRCALVCLFQFYFFIFIFFCYRSFLGIWVKDFVYKLCVCFLNVCCIFYWVLYN
jgi:hypothetical protein